MTSLVIEQFHTPDTHGAMLRGVLSCMIRSPHTSRLLGLYRRRRSTRTGPVRAMGRSVGRRFSRMSCVTTAPSGSEAPSACGRRSPPAEQPAPRP
jgi:hypothetical protein